MKLNRPNREDVGRYKSSINSKIKSQSLQENCVICGKSIRRNKDSFHKSHNIPRFVLENIMSKWGENSCVITPQFVMGSPFQIQNNNIGLNNAGVFYLL